MLRESLMRGLSQMWRRLQPASGAGSGVPWMWALNGVDLDIAEGEVVGIIGRNGAGKSTLLKVLSGITEPTAGYADIHGRVASMLEVGTGFHAELTGRENVYMNGALLGMSRREIDRKFDEIVAFSEVETFLDTPVKRYSSGMYMRLAFAVAAHLEPDVLIVDEVLAVGDMAFQKKCLGRINTIAGQGRTVLFVSHNMTAVQGLCSRVAVIEHGRVAYDGEPKTGISRYLTESLASASVPLADREDRSGDGSVRLTSVTVESLDADCIIRSTSRLKFTIGYRCERPQTHVRFIATIRDINRTGLFALDSEATGEIPEALPIAGSVECITDPINLTPGRCYVALRVQRGSIDADWVWPAVEFDVETDDFFGTGRQPTRDWVVSLLKHHWSLSE